MSPGVAAGQAEDTRCDIYAFGAMMYEMLTGKLPYNGPTVDSILEAIRTGPPIEIQKLNPDANKHLISIVETAMARELRDRYATMEDVLQDLDRVEKGQVPIGKYGQAVRRTFSPALRVLVPGLAILLTAYVVTHFRHDNPPPPSPAPTETPVVLIATPAAVTADSAYHQGLEYLEDKKYLEAEKALAQSVTLDPSQHDAWKKTGGQLFGSG